MSAHIKSHNEKAAAMWSSGGRVYDEISRSIADANEHCVTRLDPRAGEHVLDLATGTGWTSRRVAERGAAVAGADIAEGMLDAAREIATERGLDIDYRIGDAEGLPFDDGSFDAIVSTFGVMFAPGQDAAAKELARVCRKGGRIAIAAWTPNSHAVTLRKVLGPYMPPPPSSPPPSPFNWGTPAWLEERLGSDFDLGFEEATVMQRFTDAENSWQVNVAGFGPVKAVAGSLDDDRRAGLRKDFMAFYDEYRTGLGVALPIDYLVALGTRR